MFNFFGLWRMKNKISEWRKIRIQQIYVGSQKCGTLLMIPCTPLMSNTNRYLQLTVRKFRTDRHSCLRTVFCGWQSVWFARTVILAYGPLFAVDGPNVSHRPVILTYSPNTERASHYPARANCWRSVHFARTVIIAYGPSFAVDGPYVSHRPSSLKKKPHIPLTTSMKYSKCH